jgi:hypothetical protein
MQTDSLRKKMERSNAGVKEEGDPDYSPWTKASTPTTPAVYDPDDVAPAPTPAMVPPVAMITILGLSLLVSSYSFIQAVVCASGSSWRDHDWSVSYRHEPPGRPLRLILLSTSSCLLGNGVARERSSLLTCDRDSSRSGSAS